MIRGALFLLVCAACRKLAPVCEFKKNSDDQPWYVYNEEQMSRVDSTAEVLVGEYHDTTCFVERDRIEGTKMYAVSSSQLNLSESDICYGWPETESTFTRGPKLSNIEKRFTYRYEGGEECRDSKCFPSMTYSQADECMRSLPPNCSSDKIFGIYNNLIRPYESSGSTVQSFSGLGIFNFDIPLSRRIGSKFLKVPGESYLYIHLKEDLQSDCFLLLSAYSPLTEKTLPINYIKFGMSKREAKYTLNRHLIATLYNMGDFDLQFKNNHLTKPCEANDNIDFIKAESEFSIFEGTDVWLSLRTNVSTSLQTKVHGLQSCPDGGSNSVLIDMSFIKDDISKFLLRFPDNDFDLPIKLHLELGTRNLDEEIEKWEVYTTDQDLIKGCPVFKSTTGVLTKGRDYSISNVYYTLIEEGRVVVIEELRLQMADGKMIPKYVQIRAANVNKAISTVSFGGFGGLPLNRFHGDYDVDIIVEKEPIQIEYDSLVTALSGDSQEFIPLGLSKHKETTRDSRSWKTKYRNKAYDKICNICDIGFDVPIKNFWECRAKCKDADGGFVAKRKATFNKTEIPRLWGGDPHRIFGYAIDLDLPPCAQNKTRLDQLTVRVAYTNLKTADGECLYELKGNASLNVPEFTRAVYFNEITLDEFDEFEIGNVDEMGKSSSYYEFKLTLLAEIGTLPKSIIIGYKNDESCADKIENISVEYELHYKPPNNKPTYESTKSTPSPPSGSGNEKKPNQETSDATGGRKLAPVCEFKKISDDQPWYVYNEEQMSRVNSTAEREVGEYHDTTCFVETEGNSDRMEATTMYAVRSSHLELKKSDICYGWPETESTFTRGPKLSKIEKKSTYRFGLLYSDYSPNMTYSEVDEFLRKNYFVDQLFVFSSYRVKPYEGRGSTVQSFSGLGTLNFDDPLLRTIESKFSKVPEQSFLYIHLKEDSQSDCFLLLSAYSPQTEKHLPINYIKFEKSKKEAKYTLNRDLIATLYNMNEFDLQFQNNHLTYPCDDNNIDFILADSELTFRAEPLRTVDIIVETQETQRVLSKPKETTRDSRSWNTEYSNVNKDIDCGKCDEGDRLRKNFESFWDCRSKCKTDHIGFIVTRSATFSSSKVPRIWGYDLQRIFGYAIDLDLPPCAQNLTRLDQLTVTVGYKNLEFRDECRSALKGKASLNVPEFTSEIYFNEIRLDEFDYNEIGDVDEMGESLSYYEFNLTLLAEIGTLPKSIIIGFNYDDEFCADNIENIIVSYELNYKPPNSPPNETPGRKVAPVCEFKKNSDDQPWYVYNEEQMSRVDSTAEVLVGEYHDSICFVETESIPDNRMYAVSSSRLNLSESDICYGWPETESTFTRGPKLSKIEKRFTYHCEGGRDCGGCSQLMNYSEANKCLRIEPRYCLQGEVSLQVSKIKPYERPGSTVQSFSGLATLNFDDPLYRIGTELYVPGVSNLTIHLKEDRQSDCFLLLSAYSPLTEKILPINYIKFDKSDKEVKYTLNRHLIATLYNLGEFDLQFKNNHLTYPCDDNDNIASIEAASKFRIFQGTNESMSLQTKVDGLQSCQGGGSNSVLIYLSSIRVEIYNFVMKFPANDFELPIKLRLELGSQYPLEKIDKWEVYTSDRPLAKRCLDITSTTGVLTKGRDYVISKVQSTTKEKGGVVVTAELRLQMAHETMIPKHVLIRNVLEPGLKVSFTATVGLGDPPSERLQGDDKDIIVEKEPIQIEYDSLVAAIRGDRQIFMPLVLSKPKETTRLPIWRSWNTEYSNVDSHSDCGKCDEDDRKRKNFKSFWDCRSKCGNDHTGFIVTRNATFSNSEIPRPSLIKHQMHGCAIDLDLPPCAQNNTKLKYLTVIVDYTNLIPADVRCLYELKGNASLNVPEFTRAVYFNKVKLGNFVEKKIGDVDEMGKSSSYYEFNLTLLAEIGTLPQSIIIGYDDDGSCVDIIEKITVSYQLNYTPPKKSPSDDTTTMTSTSTGNEKLIKETSDETTTTTVLTISTTTTVNEQTNELQTNELQTTPKKSPSDDTTTTTTSTSTGNEKLIKETSDETTTTTVLTISTTTTVNEQTNELQPTPSRSEELPSEETSDAEYI